MRTFRLISVLAYLLLSACAPIQSIRSDNISSPTGQTGLVYHLPLKKIKLIVVVSADGRTLAPDVGVSDAYPDPDYTYFLTATHSQFGNAALAIVVNEKGLLTSAKSTSTSAVNDVLKNVAAAAATSNGLGARPFVNPVLPLPTDADPPCTLNGTYSQYVEASESGPWHLCRVKFTKDDTPKWKTPPASPEPNKQWPLSGIYYRQLMPVTVTAQLRTSDDKGYRPETLSFLVFVPNPHQVNSLEVPRNFFADNTTSMTFTDGMPTNYSPQVNSEILGLFKIPADVIGAYFGAFGNVFSAFGTAKKSESAAISNAAALQAEQYKIQLCLKAIAAKDDKGITAACPSS